MGFLDDLLPIRRLLWKSTPIAFGRDLNFDASFTYSIDANGVVTITSTALNSTSFGTDPNGKIISYVEPTFVTTNATPTSCATAIYAMPDLTLADVIITVIGKKAASADHYVQDFRARYTRNGGAPVLSGAVIAGANVDASGTLATATATLAISGNNIVPQVTGVAATNVTWSVTLQVQPVTTAT